MLEKDYVGSYIVVISRMIFAYSHRRVPTRCIFLIKSESLQGLQLYSGILCNGALRRAQKKS
jgi:hypothetical protein